MAGLGLWMGLARSTGGGGGPALGPYIATTDLYAAYGEKRIVSGYSGPLFRLRLVTGGTESDFSCAADSDSPDWAAIATWASSSLITVVTKYDQSGNTRHATNATTNQQPNFSLARRTLGLGAMYGDGPTKKLIATSLSLDRRNMSVFWASSPTSSESQSAPWQLLDGGAVQMASYFSSSRRSRTLATGEASTYPTTPDARTAIRCQPNTMGVIFSASERRYYMRETQYTDTAFTAGTGVTFHYGAGSFQGNAGFFGMAIYNVAKTALEGQAVVDALNDNFNIPTTFDRTIIGEGDSIMATGNAINGLGFFSVAAFSGAPELFNIGSAGTQMSTLHYTDRANRSLGALATNSKLGIANVTVLIQSGTNDLGGTSGVPAGISATTLYGDVATGSTFRFVKAAQALGAKAAVFTVLPRNDAQATAGEKAEIPIYNALVTGNAAGADYIVDFGNTSSTMGAPGVEDNTTYYADKLHPTTLGHTELATVLGAAGI